MKSHLRDLLLSVLIILSATFCYSQDHSQELKNKIQQIGNETVQAYLEGDLAKLFSYYADDAIQMPIYNTMIKGKEALKNREIETRNSGVEVDTLYHNTSEVWNCDRFVLEIGSYGVSMTLPQVANTVTDKGKYVTIWEKQTDGTLKIKLEIWNTDSNPFLQSEPEKN